jgi:hypothetical protein
VHGSTPLAGWDCQVVGWARETGSRMAIGADRAGVLGMLLQRRMVLAASGMALGVLLCLIAVKAVAASPAFWFCRPLRPPKGRWDRLSFLWSVGMGVRPAKLHEKPRQAPGDSRCTRWFFDPVGPVVSNPIRIGRRNIRIAMVPNRKLVCKELAQDLVDCGTASHVRPLCFDAATTVRPANPMRPLLPDSDASFAGCFAGRDGP